MVKRVLVAIDSFKGSFSSLEAVETVRVALDPKRFAVTGVSIADGGEGTSAAFLANHSGGEWVKARVTDPLGQLIDTRFAFQPNEQLAVIDSAEASGLQFVRDANGCFADPWQTSSVGTGELIRQAVAHGAKRIAVGLGGTGTNDCGIGLLGALGGRFFASDGAMLPPVATSLAQVARIDWNQLVTNHVELIACADVDNPLIGANGATRMFGPQKGVLTQQAAMEAAFTRFAQAADPVTLGRCPGDGAAGGMGFALRLAGAQQQSGFDLIADTAGLAEKVEQADLVLTGEGRLDQQSLHGKVPVRVAQLSARHQTPCIGLAGQVDLSVAELQAAGFTSAFSIVQRAQSLTGAIEAGKVNLQKLVERLAPLLELL